MQPISPVPVATEARLRGRLVRLRRRTHQVLFDSDESDSLSRIDDVVLPLVIVISVAAMILETVPAIYAAAPRLFRTIEAVSLGIFTVEYLLRLWCAAEAGPRGRRRFAFGPLGVIDLAAIVPFYLPFLGIDLRGLRAVRLLRMLRIAKLARYSVALQTFARVFSAKREEMGVVLALLTILLVVSSSLLYFAEHAAQPDKFSSIPASMWWAIATLTTVGYGDVFPITPIGRLLGAVIAILGIGMFALPTGILGAAFMEEVQSRHSREDGGCPLCGK